MTETSDASDRTQQIIAEAREASADTEDKLARMRRIKRKLIPDLEQEYERLRDELVASDAMLTARHFISEDEGKLVGFVVRPGKTTLHHERVADLPEDVQDAIAPRKIVSDKLKAAVQKGLVTPQQLVRLMTFKDGAGTPHIRFIETGESD